MAKTEGIDFSALAKSTKPIAKLPSTGGTAITENAFTALVQQSLDTGKPMQLPAVPDEDTAAKVRYQIWRAGRLLDGVKVSTRATKDANGGIVVSFEAKKDANRTAK
jgi:hypothetical protein